MNKTKLKLNVIKTDTLGNNAWHKQYRIPIYGLEVGGFKVDYPWDEMNKGLKSGEGAFFDSGTTFMYVSYDLFDKLQEKFANFCKLKKELCGGSDRWDRSCYSPSGQGTAGFLPHFFKSFPTLDFDVGAKSIYRLYPSDYLLKKENSDQYCIGIEPLKNMILGAVFWRNYDIFIDKESRTVGFVRSDCTKSGAVDFYDPTEELKILKVYFFININYEDSAANVNSSNWSTVNLHSNKNKQISVLSTILLVLLLVIFFLMMCCLAKFLL